MNISKRSLFFLLLFGVLILGIQGINAQDSDNDSVPDAVDIDDDNDGILDTNEGLGCPGFLNYEFYDLTPTGNTVDNIPTTGSLASGTISSFDVDALQNLVDPGDRERFSIRYTGQVYIENAATYTFYTSSDDGSKLFVNGTEVVDNDGLHGVVERSGTISLSSGFHEITVSFFERTGGEFLSVSYESAAISKREVPFGILFSNLECDFDGDGVPNHLDLDTDNDGIPDNIEGQATAAYIAPLNVDSDLNGLDDAYETSPGSGEGVFPLNTNSENQFDFANLDTDDDGNNDTLEAGITLLSADTDGDGLDDAIDTSNTPLPGGLPDYNDANGTIDIPLNLPNLQNPNSAEVDYRDASVDTDNDGVADATDVDDDNDGISDLSELLGCAGSIDYEFYDLAPNSNTVDNIPTSGALDTGVISSFDVDALQNLVDPGDGERFSIRYIGNLYIENTATYTFYTSSDDGSKLLLDGIEVVDNDGLHGVRERSGAIFLNAGFHEIIVTFFELTGGEFLSVSYESSTISKRTLPFDILFPNTDCDFDNDGIPNRLDTDSDNDGCNDVIEAYGVLEADLDNDGVFGTGIPTVNEDGSVVEASYQNPIDVDSSGVFDFIEVPIGTLPAITTQPIDINTCPGCSTLVSVVANGTIFQWQFFDGTDWVDLSDGGIYSGVTTDVLTITGPPSNENGLQLRVLVFNADSICNTISDIVTLALNVSTVITNRRITYRINRN